MVTGVSQSSEWYEERRELGSLEDVVADTGSSKAGQRAVKAPSSTFQELRSPDFASSDSSKGPRSVLFPKFSGMSRE
jgi:hypothetical protein